jgi:uroporphyrin-3 C-methyltransferase
MTAKPTSKKPKIAIKIIFHLIILIIFVGCLVFLGWQNYQLQNKTQSLQIALQKVQEQKPSDWVLPEIDYLIRVANINLHINRDIPVALNLLQTADKRLAILNNPAFIPIRQTLTNDIRTLQAAPKIDTAGTISQIAALSQQIENISITPKMLTKQKEKTSPKIKIKTQQSLWQRFWQVTGQKLKDIIIIRHLEQPIEPLPTLEQQVYLKQNIEFMLEQAEWAVLHRDSQIYNSALKRAEQMIHVYLAHNLSELNNVSQTLQKLQKININPPMPDISQSIQAINELIKKDQL